jgi:hypothetical protein
MTLKLCKKISGQNLQFSSEISKNIGCISTLKNIWLNTQTFITATINSGENITLRFTASKPSDTFFPDDSIQISVFYHQNYFLGEMLLR